MPVESQLTLGPNEHGVYLGILRRSGHGMSVDGPKWFASLGIKTVLFQSQSESDGNITLVITYRKD
jgi:hypothetical protein